MEAWRDYAGRDEWRRVLRGPEEEKSIGLLRQRTASGGALAGKRGLEKMEAALGRRVRPLPEGLRPKKPKEQRPA